MFLQTFKYYTRVTHHYLEVLSSVRILHDEFERKSSIHAGEAGIVSTSLKTSAD